MNGKANKKDNRFKKWEIKLKSFQRQSRQEERRPNHGKNQIAIEEVEEEEEIDNFDNQKCRMWS